MLFVLLAAAVLLIAPASPLAASGSHAIQGSNCQLAGVDAASAAIDLSVSTIACPGTAMAPLDLAWPGYQRGCIYIDNATTAGFFVPLKTAAEWLAFQAAVETGALRGRASITYGCNAAEHRDACGETYLLPAARHGETNIATSASGQQRRFVCTALAGCGSWSPLEPVQCPVNGACGTVTASRTRPASNLCTAGTPSTVLASSAEWLWACTGLHGGSTAACSAPVPAPAEIFRESFEVGHALPRGSWGVFANWNGWSTRGPGIEIDGIGAITPVVPDGSFHCELDSHDFATATGNSSMWRSMQLSPGRYRLSWYYLARVSIGSSPAAICGPTASMEALPDSQSTDRIDVDVSRSRSGAVLAADTCLTAPGWTLRTIEFDVHAEDDYQIRFTAAGADDSFGGLVDDISLILLGEPETADR